MKITDIFLNLIYIAIFCYFYKKAKDYVLRKKFENKYKF